MGIDELDRQIIGLLQRDGRMPNSEIARHLGVAEGTVRRRIERLIHEGIVKIAAVANPFKIGLNTVALISVDVDLPRLTEVAQELVRMKEVRYVGYATGAHDIIIECLFPSNQALLKFLIEKLAQVPGVRRTETSIQLDILKRSYEWEIPPISELDFSKSRLPKPRGISRGQRPKRRLRATRLPIPNDQSTNEHNPGEKGGDNP
ncbi:MAG: Lrp/AsnC family transcriptional regulator [Armatimonadota bacterium]|nr:Lrp/AsnC family transcriptional regulator [Armatimonadota bacterium]